MLRVKITLVAGLALLALAIGLVLAHAPMSVAYKNGTAVKEERIAYATEGATYCQAGELLPRGTTAIRLSFSAFSGPRVRVAVSAAGHVLSSGEQGSGWGSRIVTVPLTPYPRTVFGTTVCASFQMHDEGLTVYGRKTPVAVAAYEGEAALLGRMWIEYLRPGTRSWASMIPAIVRHMGLGRPDPGEGIVFVALALLATIALLATDLIRRELR